MVAMPESSGKSSEDFSTGAEVDASAPQPSIGSTLRLNLAILVVGIVILSALQIVAHNQEPRGDQFALPPATFTMDWWLSPYEVHAFNRQIGPRIESQLLSVQFHVDGLRGWAVGSGGTILATHDGGQSWQTQPANSKAVLQSIFFLSDGMRGWAIGEDGTILATIDGGQSWLAQVTNSKAWLQSVTFLPDGMHGWAVGKDGAILATIDGGQSWLAQVTNSKAWLQSVTFLPDGMRGWVVGWGGPVLATRDGGKSWQTLASNSESLLNSITFLPDGMRGWAVGENGTILATRDGGRSWQTLASNSKASLNSITFLQDGLRGWAVGSRGTVLATRDGGQSWQTQTLTSTEKLTSVTFLPDGLHGWAVGFGGTVLTTRDGGQSWQTLASNSKTWLNSITFLPDGLRGWAVGWGGTILATRDGGQSWQTLATNSKASLNSITFLPDGLHGWAVGDSIILTTRDGGQSWQTQTSNLLGTLNSVTFLTDGMRGWAVGNLRTILATRDGGQSWQTQTLTSTEELTSITFLPDGLRGWAVGRDLIISSSTILATRDGGQSWQTLATISKAWLQSVTFLPDGIRGWAVGKDGTILATRDGGQSWQAQVSSSKAWLQSVTFLPDGQRGWAVGSGGTTLATRDGGQSWNIQVSTSKARLQSVTFLPDGLRGWAVGEDGTILSTRNGDQSWQTQARYHRYPAPWFWLVSLVVALGTISLMAWRIVRQSVQKLRNRILGAAVDDGPITELTRDRLGFAPVVDALTAFMRHEKTLPSVTFAITAKWGRGKSSMMRMLQDRLQSQGVPTVWFNAWHHQQEPVLLAPLLEAISRQATPPWLSLLGIRLRMSLLWRRFKQHPWIGFGPIVLSIALALGTLISIAGAFQPHESGQPHPVVRFWASGAEALFGAMADNHGVEELLAGNVSAYASKTVGALVTQPLAAWPVALALYVLASLWLLIFHYLRAFPASPSALLASLGNRFNLRQAEEQTGFRQRFREHFRQVCEALQPYTLTIFIDDLDRCEANKCAEMLEAVNYLADAGKCFVVVGIAKEIVEAQLGEAFKDIATTHAAFSDLTNNHSGNSQPDDEDKDRKSNLDRQNYARDYLRKLIQIEIPVLKLSDATLRELLGDSESIEARWNVAWDGLGRYAKQGIAAAKFLVVACLIGWIFLQLQLWIETREAEFQQKSEPLLSQWRESRQRADDIAIYAAWLEYAGQSMQGAGTSLDSARTRARFAQIQDIQRKLDSNLDDLRSYAELGREKPFQKRIKIVTAALDQAASIRISDSEWARMQAKKGKNIAPLSTSKKTPVEPSRAPTSDKNASPTILSPVPQPEWPYTLGFIILTGSGLLLLLRSKDRFKIEESDDYRKALTAWQPVLTVRDQFRSPREAKRFLNLSRYLTLRINSRKYTKHSPVRTWIGKALKKISPQEPSDEIPESTIVGLTALYLSKPPELITDGSIIHFMASPATILFGRNGEDGDVCGAVEGALAMIGRERFGENEITTFLRAVGELVP